MKRLFQISGGTGATDATDGEFRCNIDIKVLKHPGHAINTVNDNVAMRFKVFNAWITSVAYSDLNAGDNALMVEQMSVVHEGFEMKLAENYNGSGADAINFN
jgi:phage tail-like protein